MDINMGDNLQVKFWGTRGSCAAPFPDRMKYGGNTSCVSVQWKEGIAVFDGGTGIVAFGKELEKACFHGEKEKDVSIFVFVSHVHLDHIIGIPMFSCLFWKEATIHFFGPGTEEESFCQRLSKVLGHPYWPVTVDQVPANVVWHDTGREMSWKLPGNVLVRAMSSNHPNGGYLYRLEKGSQSVVYGLDCELGEQKDGKKEENIGENLEPEKTFWENYRKFALDCSLLIFDAPYTEENYIDYRGFGHSFWQQGLVMAQECNAGHLCICHHDWSRTDEQLAQKEHELQMFAEKWGKPAEFAKEGVSIYLENR